MSERVAGMARVLGDRFPPEKERLDSLAHDVKGHEPFVLQTER